MPKVAPNVVVSVITPFAPGGQLDEVLLRAQLRRMAAAGVAVNVAGSGAGARKPPKASLLQPGDEPADQNGVQCDKQRDD